MKSPVIVIATPHQRGESVEKLVRQLVPQCTLVRLTTRESLNVANLTKLDPTWVFFPHWSWLIPREVHERFRCVIFHMTDLPYGRGGSPLQNLIVRGHQETVICALKCVAELDAGPVYLRRSLSLQGTAEEILQTASAVIGEMIGEIVRKEPVPIAQVGEPVVFQRRGPEDGNLLQADGLRQVFDYIRMLDAEGYPPAFIQVGALRLEFSEASLGDQVVTARVQITRANIHEK